VLPRRQEPSARVQRQKGADEATPRATRVPTEKLRLDGRGPPRPRLCQDNRTGGGWGRSYVARPRPEGIGPVAQRRRRPGDGRILFLAWEGNERWSHVVPF